jgi:predicted O-methyltransferase YrrM
MFSVPAYKAARQNSSELHDDRIDNSCSIQIGGGSQVTFEDYLKNIPLLHTWDGGKTWRTGGFQAPHLATLFELVEHAGGRDARVLETGAGNSTIAFLYARPRQVVSVAPDADLFKRILRFCEANGVDHSALVQIVNRSEWALPEIAKEKEPFDLVLIDGNHGWPAVFVDFCYAYATLRKGGILIIDDLQLYSVKELARLMVVDTNRFSSVRDMGKAIAFSKNLDDEFLPDWGGLPYIQRKTERYLKMPNPHTLDDV